MMKTMPVYLVRADDESAMRLVRKLCGEALKPNTMVPLDKGEWIALHKSVIRLDIEHPAE